MGKKDKNLKKKQVQEGVLEDNQNSESKKFKNNKNSNEEKINLTKRKY